MPGPRGGVTRVQTLLFPKDVFTTRGSVLGWIERHPRYHADTIEDSGRVREGNYWRVRQYNPSGAAEKTIHFGDSGILAVVEIEQVTARVPALLGPWFTLVSGTKYAAYSHGDHLHIERIAGGKGWHSGVTVWTGRRTPRGYESAWSSLPLRIDHADGGASVWAGHLLPSRDVVQDYAAFEGKKNGELITVAIGGDPLKRWRGHGGTAR
jgi:hypothetical protein